MFVGLVDIVSEIEKKNNNNNRIPPSVQVSVRFSLGTTFFFFFCILFPLVRRVGYQTCAYAGSRPQTFRAAVVATVAAAGSDGGMRRRRRRPPRTSSAICRRGNTGFGRMVFIFSVFLLRSVLKYYPLPPEREGGRGKHNT